MKLPAPLLAARRLLTQALEGVIILAMAVLTLDVLWGVVSRYVLVSPSRWTEELATALLVWVSLLGAAAAFGEKAHLGVDALVQKLHPDVQALLDVIVNLVTIAFAGAVMVFGGYVLVTKTLASGQVTPALGMKAGWIYCAVPLSGLFIILFALENIAERLAGTKAGEAGETVLDF
jgi:TRAP-type C4-dicarboxylate transport system permease small subunit